jgi:hypothetical protein
VSCVEHRRSCHVDLMLLSRNLASQETPPKAGVKFSTGDFFALKLSEEGKIDVVYDYTCVNGQKESHIRS